MTPAAIAASCSAEDCRDLLATPVMANFSLCSRYRYMLRRELASPLFTPRDRKPGYALWIMLNPSTADAVRDDPTIRRCIGFTRRWGYKQMVVANLYALRSTDPKALWLADDPVGPDNDQWLQVLMEGAEIIIAAWGASAEASRERAAEDMLHGVGRAWYCLGRTRLRGDPVHPLYIPGETELEPFDMLWGPR